MKKKLETPTLDICEFVVAARLEGSGVVIGSAHSNAPLSPCSKVASNGSNSCTPPTFDNSSIGNDACSIIL